MARVVRLSYEDFVDDSTTTITGSTAASNLPDDNVADNFVAVAWRTTGVTDENIVINLGSAKQVKVIGIFGHNFTSGATITLQANATDAWTSPSFSQALTVETDPLSDVIPKICYFTDKTYQYWRVRMQDSSNSDGYLEIGRLWLGTYWQPSYNFSNGFTVNIVKPDQVDRPTIGGPYGREIPSYELISFGWQAGANPLGTSDRETLEAVYRKVGRTKPVVLVYDATNDPSVTAIYGFFENERLSRTHSFVENFGSEGLVLREDVGWHYV